MKKNLNFILSSFIDMGDLFIQLLYQRRIGYKTVEWHTSAKNILSKACFQRE